MVFAQAVTVFAGIGVGTLLARSLGVEGYGQYVFALTIVQVMMVPLDFGLPTLVMREVAILRTRTDWALLKGLLRWSSTIIAVAVAMLVIGVLTVNSLTGREDLLYLAAAVLAGVWVYLRLASAVLRGMKQVVQAAMPDQVIRPLTMLSALVLISLVGALTPARAMALHALAAAVGLCWAVWMLRRHSRPILPGQSGKARYAPQLWLRSTLFLGLNMGGGILKQRSDMLMLGILADTAQVGLYGFAVLIAGVANMPQTLIKQMIDPRFATAHANNSSPEIERLARLSARFVVAGSLCVMLTLFFFGGPIVDAVIGVEFSDVIPLALIVAAGPALGAAFGPVASILNMTGKEKVTAKQSWISAAVNISFNALLIPWIGAYGAALATACTSFSQRFLLWRAVRAHHGINPAIFARLFPRKYNA
ncbi:polysaccharide biosynthesis C-terminal domain-containing protein [Aestuariicoccus sp. MJ-SS9]|uniref:oligosaccharide flippase family protein n=1 Tax=Aestuariicoccus sp. MJ-SS9 TaxID=3079855 RepID=UPI002930FD5F|nr:polysaccharide biosynthesis C-terminal domain-containing protein [Aestuariicoccus sp. MJ-SS9]